LGADEVGKGAWFFTDINSDTIPNKITTIANKRFSATTTKNFHY